MIVFFNDKSIDLTIPKGKRFFAF